MSLTQEQRREIEQLISDVLRKKLSAHELKNKNPFNIRLLGRDNVAVHSFIQSVSTSLGMSVFERMAMLIAKPHFATVEGQVVIDGDITAEANGVIQGIIDDLRNKKDHASPNAGEEIDALRRVCRRGARGLRKMSKVDVRLVDASGKIHMLEFKTVLPNKEAFVGFKRQLLEWVAVTLCQNPKADVSAMLALPYNPHEPNEYNWLNGFGMLEKHEQIKVGADMWNFCAGGEDVYQEVLDCFKNVGVAMRDDIDNHVKNLKRRL